MSQFTREVTETEFEDIVLQSSKPVLVDFWAPWCGPCRAMAPVLDGIAQQRDDATVLKVNVDENPSVSARYNIRGIPTLILFREGKEAGRLIGLQDGRKIAELIQEHSPVQTPLLTSEGSLRGMPVLNKIGEVT